MLFAPLLALALLGPLAGSGEESAWSDVELPVGFHLDLATGWVSNRAPGEAERGVIWDGESLRGPALLKLAPGGSQRARVERGEGGAPQAGEAALVGGEWLYELGELGWGYLRVLAKDSGRISLERAHCDPEWVELERAPAGISWSASEEGVLLSWARSAEVDASWLVERRALRARGATPWEAVAMSERPWWTDTEAMADVVLEYRVLLVGGGMGSRVRAVAGGVSDGLIEVTQGSGVNALTGEVGGAREDIRLEYINPKGVQIGPGKGVVMRTIVPAGREAWELPHRDAPGYGPQRYFLSEGRDLAVYLPEGLYARLSLGEIGDGSVSLRVSTAIDGGRVLLPAPAMIAARGLSDGGAEVTAEAPHGYLGLSLGEPILILEREQGFESEEWVFVTESVTSGREVLMDARPTVTGPCRYRCRVRLGPHGPSAPSAPISVLLGDDGGPQAEAWIRAAVEELGQQDYERRRRARELLAVVGARARPLLLEAVSSENPEQAAAAKDLLSGLRTEEKGTKPMGRVVPEILLRRASAKGLAEDALPGFLSADAVERAFVALGAADVGAVAEHLKLLAEFDPELLVRDAASMALSLPPRVPASSPRVPFERLTLFEVATELERHEASDPAQLADSLNAAVRAERDAWTALIALQVSGDLEASLGDLAEEEAATSRARLALALLRDRAEGRDAPASFLAAALDVVSDPLIRFGAARRMAETVFEAPVHEGAALRIEAGDFDDLASVLDECRRSGQGARIVLSEGVYEAPSGGLSTLRTGGEGVHLVGEGEVVIHASLIIDEGAVVALENIRLEPRTGIGITIHDGNLLLIDSHISATSISIQATDSLVALSGSMLADPPRSGGGKGGPVSVRFMGLSALFARDSRISSSSACVQGARLVFLDTCALASVDRSALEGQGRMEIFAVRTVLFGGHTALAGAGTGVLDGVVLGSPGQATQRVGEGLHICREHTSGGEEPGELWTKGISTDCTLEHR